MRTSSRSAPNVARSGGLLGRRDQHLGSRQGQLAYQVSHGAGGDAEHAGAGPRGDQHAVAAVGAGVHPRLKAALAIARDPAHRLRAEVVRRPQRRRADVDEQVRIRQPRQPQAVELGPEVHLGLLLHVGPRDVPGLADVRDLETGGEHPGDVGQAADDQIGRPGLGQVGQPRQAGRGQLRVGRGRGRKPDGLRGPEQRLVGGQEDLMPGIPRGRGERGGGKDGRLPAAGGEQEFHGGSDAFR